jgi:gluconokinase
MKHALFRNTKAIVVMGVSGSGKTTFGSALAQVLNWEFADADDYHPQFNRQKMARGEALDDSDRQPWLMQLHALLAHHLHLQRPVVLACSALKTAYREVLIGQLEGIGLIFLQGNPELIAKRVAQRQHFMPPSLLESQLATLEPPADALVLDIGKPIDVLVQETLKS